jgi:hypothetical protein
MTYTINALPVPVLDDVRTRGVDVSGTPVEQMTATGGEPLRCCLRDATPGESLILFGYEPPLPASPYREVGAVFAHAEACAGPVEGRPYPADWYGRRQVLRAYDDRGWIHPSTRVHDGDDPEALLAAMFEDPAVAQIHSRNVAYGCFMFTATRA